MQPGVPRPYHQSMLDFGRSGAGAQFVASAARPMAYSQGGFLDEQSAYAMGADEDWAGAGGRKPGVVASASAAVGAAAAAAFAGAQAGSAYSAYLGAQAGYSGGYPATKPPTFPPPQPPAGIAGGLPGAPLGTAGFSSDSEFPALGGRGAGEVSTNSPAVTGRGPGSHLVAQPTDLSRSLLHAQPPPPPSKAPHVLPTQPPIPQGPPPLAPPLMSPPPQPSRASDLSEEDRKKEEMLYLTTPEAERAAREKYCMLGILKVIRMKDPDLNMLALGMDLTTLGLNLNSPENLYSTFASPWSETPARKDPEFYLPQCYYMNPPHELKTAHLQKFSLETLFYIFFKMPRDTLQAYAAAELYNRGYKYHRDLKAWFVQQEEKGEMRWTVFDPIAWEKQYYDQQVDTSGFLTEDDVRVKVQPSGSGVAQAPTE